MMAIQYKNVMVVTLGEFLQTLLQIQKEKTMGTYISAGRIGHLRLESPFVVGGETITPEIFQDLFIAIADAVRENKFTEEEAQTLENELPKFTHHVWRNNWLVEIKDFSHNPLAFEELQQINSRIVTDKTLITREYLADKTLEEMKHLCHLLSIEFPPNSKQKKLTELLIGQYI
jgi:hypothetical protein